MDRNTVFHGIEFQYGHVLINMFFYIVPDISAHSNGQEFANPFTYAWLKL